MRSVESEGDSIDKAIEKALQTLQVARDQVEIEILADVTRGLFGFGGTRARVRATVRASLASQLEDVAEPRTGSRETSATSSPRHDSNSGTPAPAMTGRPSADLAERSRTVLGEMLSHLGVSAEVKARIGEDPGVLVLEINGDSGGLLIGRRGQTLDAIEYVVSRMLARDSDAPPVRVMIDVEHYRERREEYLTALAHRLADKVKQTHRVVTLNPMSPRDRRIVHIALKDEAAVTTRSQGDGHYRKVLIIPADRVRRDGPNRPVG